MVLLNYIVKLVHLGKQGERHRLFKVTILRMVRRRWWWWWRRPCQRQLRSRKRQVLMENCIYGGSEQVRQQVVVTEYRLIVCEHMMMKRGWGEWHTVC
jgi:hypothetical protein